MAIVAIDDSQRTAAKVAGLTYLISFAVVVFANYAVHERLIVSGNIAQTARNFAASQQLLRISIGCDLIYCAGLVVLLTALYAVLNAVNHNLALLAAVLRLVYAAMWVLMTLELLKILRLSSRPDSLALMKLNLGARSDEYYVGLLFYGLASTVCSYLWLKSHYIPGVLAGFGVVTSAWSAACALAFIIYPSLAGILNPYWYDSALGVFEIALGFWLLFKGLTPAASTNDLL